MIFTDAEARKRICPFSFSSEGVIPCVARNCMAWREVPEEVENTETLLGRSPPGEGWVELERRGSPGLRWQRVSQKAGGYCGRIGKP